MLHSYPTPCYTHDSHDKNLSERTLSTIGSSALGTTSVPVMNHIAMGRDNTMILLKSDWRGVD